MKDLRTILITPLFAALTAATGRNVFTKMPIDSEYPYIFISDFFQKESGPKLEFMYDVELLIQVRHVGLTSMKPLYDDMDAILSLVNNDSPFALADPYKIEQCTLISSNDTEILTDTGTENIGLIRINFLII
jgi:hypothetical protein